MTKHPETHEFIELDSIEVAVNIDADYKTWSSIDHRCISDPRDEKFVKEHVLPAQPNSSRTANCLKDVRDAFWEFYKRWAKQCIVVADCGTPTEAYFLRLCVLDDFPTRKWEAPYPLHDLGTLLLARSMDPIGEYPRTRAEIPKHNPLCDARQSARLFLEYL